MDIARSTNAGVTWATWYSSANGGLKDIETSPTSSGMVYTAGYDSGGIGQVLRVTESAATDVTGDLRGRLPPALTAVCLDSTRPSLVLVASAIGVFRSTNATTTAANWYSTDLQVATVDLLNSPQEGACYAATQSNGVYRSADGGCTWIAVNRGLTNRNCGELALDTDGKRLFVGTSEGVWRTRVGPVLTVHGTNGASSTTVETNWYGVVRNHSVASPVTDGSTQYVHTGWALTGQTDTNGASAGSGTSMFLMHTNDATLTWFWQTNYWCTFASNGLGSVSLSNSWLPRGGVFSIAAIPAYTNRFHHWSGTGTNFIVAGNASTPTVQVAAAAPFDLIANFISAYEAWRQAYFTAEQLGDPLISGEDADPDHDGMSNRQEYLAGTGPTDAESCLKCSGAPAVASGGIVLQWQSASGKVYSVSVSTNLLSDLFTNRLATGILATPPTNTYEDAVSRSNCAFYRVTVEKPDPFFPDISAAQALQVIAARGGDPDFVVLDVRTAGEYAERHIQGAINLDYYAPDFAAQLNALDKNKAYLIHCGSGVRSGPTHEIMLALGFHEVYDMSGGIEAFEVLPGAGVYLTP